MSDTRNFKSFLTAYMEITDDDKSPACYRYWSAVSIIAGAVANKVWFTPNGRRFEYPNLYVMLVGELNSGKSTAAENAMALLRQVPGFNLGASKLTDSSLIASFSRSGQKRKVEILGETYKAGDLFLFASEASQTFKSRGQGNSIIGAITDFYNANGSQFWSQKPIDAQFTRTHDSEEIYNYCLNILGCSTAEWLMTKVLSREDIAGGTGSRFTLVVNTEKPAVREIAITDGGSLRTYTKLHEDLITISKMQGRMTVTPGFIAREYAYKVQHESHMETLKHVDRVLFDCTRRKAEPQLMRLSMLLAIDEGTMEITEEHCMRAWQLLTELETNMPTVLGKYGVSQEVQDSFAMLAYLEDVRPRCVSTKHLIDAMKKRYGSVKVKMCIGELKSWGVLSLNAGLSNTGNFVYDVNLKPPGLEALKPAPSEGQSSRVLSLPSAGRRSV